jgi:magnesium transporter
VARELLVGLVNGVSLALVMGLATYLFFGPSDHHDKLAIIVGAALIANIFTAALGGILMPLALEKMGRDPAVSSSIFVTFLTDFTGFFAVLLIASLLLH